MPTQFGPWCLDYPRRWEERRSSTGETFKVFAAYGMPRLHEELKVAAFYLFPDEASANAGKNIGGTGFLVGMSSTEVPNLIHFYAVTNHHVVFGRPPCPIIRLNTKNGGHKNHVVDLADWEPHPEGDDLAILAIDDLDGSIYHATFFHESCFVHKEHMGPKAEHWAEGDSVFMIGLFTGYAGDVKNEPTVRSGVIALIPQTPISQRPDRNFDQESICLDMRSVGGFSGSPVIVYRPKLFDVIGPTSPTETAAPFQLLGIHWGNIPDISEAKSVGAKRERKIKLKGHAGITCLVPAWKLLEFLMKDKFKKQRIKDERDWAKKHAPKPSGTLESANPNHREDFERLLTRSVKPKK